MTQSVNQFKQAPVKGQLDLQLNIQNLAVRHDPDAVADLVKGQAVKILDSAKGGVPIVQTCADDADAVMGFVNYDPKKNSYGAGEYLSISFFRGNVMYMEASAAVARDAEIAIVISGQKVRTAVSTDRIVGHSIDKATADGDLIRVVIDLPGAIKA